MPPEKSTTSWRTKLQHPDAAPEGFKSLAPATYRASTTVLPNLPTAGNATWREQYTYGMYGTPTTLDLAQRIASMCGGAKTTIVPSGQAAIALVYLAFVRPGDHVLLPVNIYGTNSDMTEQLLVGLNVEATYYDPMAPITPLLRPNTRLVWLETPGSVTMEIADIPALVNEVRAYKTTKRIITAIDDTYSAGVLFRPFDHGVDIAVQALTKYIGGHSDLLLGSVTSHPSNDAEVFEAIGTTHRILGLSASPDDCSLALRGLLTLDIRLKAYAESALAIAQHLAKHPAVECILHPSFPTCPGHETFKRDFTAPASIFSFVLKEPADLQRVTRFVDKLKLFQLGYSWGGTSSVVMAYPYTDRVKSLYGERLIRLGIGLEDTADLIADLDQALSL